MQRKRPKSAIVEENTGGKIDRFKFILEED